MNANENNNRDDAEVPHEIPPAVPSTSDEEEGNVQKKTSHESAEKSELNNQSNERDKDAYVREQNNSGILYSQTIVGNPNNNQMMYPNNGSQQFQQPAFDQGLYPPPPNNNNMPYNQYPLNDNQLPPQHNNMSNNMNMNNILSQNLGIPNQPITMQLPPIPPPPPQPSFLPPNSNDNNVGGLDAQRQYYEEQMRQHALQYANAAAGAAWAAARIACGGGNNVNSSMSGDIVLQNPGGGFMPNQIQQQASYYTPAASRPRLIDNSTQQQHPEQKRTLWQPSSPGNMRRSSGLKIEAKPKSSQQQQDKKRSKKRESGNSSVSSLGSDSRDLKGIGSSNKKLSGKKSSQRRRFNEDSNTEGVKTSVSDNLGNSGARQKRALQHGHGSKSSFSSLGSNSNNNQGRNKKKNRSQSNSSSPQKSTGSKVKVSILPPPPSIFLGGLLGKNGVRALHELCGKYHWDMPKYTLVDPQNDAQNGAQLSDNDGSVKSHYYFPVHEKQTGKDTFYMTVHVNGVELGRGRGGMKNAAKQDGSRKALAALVPGVIFDPNGILTDIGGTRRKSLSLDELGPHLASQLAIGGVNGPLGGGGVGIDGGDQSETSSISTAIEIAEDVIGHGALVSGGPLLSSKLGALSSPGGSLNASGSGRIFSSNIYPSSGVSSASDVDDDDENAYYASRGASVCSTLLHAMWQIDDRIRDPPSYSFDLCPSINSDTASSGEAASSPSKQKKAEPREAPSQPRMFQCIATINLYFPKHLVGDNDDIMTYWQSPLDYLQAKYSSSSPTSDKVESSQSRKRKDSFSFESPSPNKAARPNHSTNNEHKEETAPKIESKESEKKEEIVLHKLTGTGLGSTKRESKHKASAQLLSSLFPECSSIVEVKAEAEASRELYAANRVATSQTKRAKLSSPESKKSSKRSSFSATPSTAKSGISLLGLSLSEPKRAKRTQWTANEQKQQTFQDEVDAALLSLQELVDEAESNNDDDKVGRLILRRATEDDVDHIHALMEKCKSSSSKKECSATQNELNFGDEDPESDNVDEAQEQELELSDETFILVLSRAVATQDPLLGCAILTLDTSSEERALLSRIVHEKHLPREHFDECLETFAKSINCSIEANSNTLADQLMTLETIRLCISRSSQAMYQAEDVKSYHQLHSVKEEENEESESDGDKKESGTFGKEASKPSKRSRVV